MGVLAARSTGDGRVSGRSLVHLTRRRSSVGRALPVKPGQCARSVLARTLIRCSEGRGVAPGPARGAPEISGSETEGSRQGPGGSSPPAATIPPIELGSRVTTAERASRARIGRGHASAWWALVGPGSAGPPESSGALRRKPTSYPSPTGKVGHDDWPERPCSPAARSRRADWPRPRGLAAGLKIGQRFSRRLVVIIAVTALRSR